MSNDEKSLAALRRDYELFELNESDAAADPVEQFARWFADAKTAQVLEPNAMALATADAGGRPAVRMVLLKEFDSTGFNFYTNMTSSKGRDLAENPRASLLFWWAELERQVRIEGTVSHVSREQTERYFHSRPLAAQLGAWASQQSSVLKSREELEARLAEYSALYAGKEVPVPDYWGGYRLAPESIEFWQGRASRLHDRLRYVLIEGKWKLERLSP
jgi:pyridoxamine 5'-phosphate oxidase